MIDDSWGPLGSLVTMVLNFALLGLKVLCTRQGS